MTLEQKMSEALSEEERKRLAPHVTNLDDNVFALINLPEVVKGALFSRYSRSTKGLRRLLLDEFSPESGEGSFGVDPESLQKASAFYDRILDGYGDDSVGELGGAHLAFEDVSILATKVIEDARIGGSPLEKSTRYVRFDEKENGEYRFYEDPVLRESPFGDACRDHLRRLFDTYRDLIPPLTEFMEMRVPREEGVSENAWKRSLRAKVCDVLRGLLPAATKTNLGIFGNGRFFEALLGRLHSGDCREFRDLAVRAHAELAKVIPSFVRRGEKGHRHQVATEDYQKERLERLAELAQGFQSRPVPQAIEHSGPVVRLLEAPDPEKAEILWCVHALYPYSGVSLGELEARAAAMSPEERHEMIVADIGKRENRRHRPGRELELLNYRFEFEGDYGMFRDLHRHRMLTQQRQPLSTRLGYTFPVELDEAGLGDAFRARMEDSVNIYEKVVKDYPNEAQYLVPLAFHLRWQFSLNARSLLWLTELRSAPQGHTTYRVAAQEMAKQAIVANPVLGKLLTFVDYNDYSLGRLAQEEKTEQRQQK